jgi:hypothetical protein
MPAITPLPTPPSTSDPENFATEADAFLGALPTFGDELNEFAENLNNFSTSATSVTSNTVGTGSKAFTVETGKSFLPGQSLTIARTAAPANRMFAVVDSYNSGTGALVVTAQAFEGSGTFVDWTITLGFNGVINTEQIENRAVTAVKLDDAIIAPINDFRLTLTTGVPVTTSDVIGATTIYCCPYKGNRIALYDGTNWNLRTSAEFSLALGTITAARPYDVFCYDNAGVPTLEFTAWTNATTRATALTYQDGVLVKTGATTRRYLGTFYTTSTTTTEDSFTKRFLWNYYNRIKRSLLKRDATASWTYTTATPRYANNNAANIVDMVIGVSEDSVSINLDVAFTNSGGNVNISTGIGFDGISTFVGQGGKGATSTAISTVNARFEGYPNIGRHFFSWVESSTAVGTTTWYGTNTSSGIDFYSGLSGSLLG